MSHVSVIIPARNEPFLNKTIKCVRQAQAGDLEIIVVLDGDPPVKPIHRKWDVRVIQNERPQGIGAATWAAAQVATGEYLMKLDAHCLLADRFDETLAGHCGPTDLLVPARYQLKDVGWRRGYGPIHYLHLTFPWLQEPQFGAGMHGKKWQCRDGLGKRAVGRQYFWPERAWADRAPLDEIMAFQGSLWFMHRDRFLELDGVDRRCILWGESLNLGFKVWMSGGRLLRDKSTWYAHLHKGQRHGRGYHMTRRTMQRINLWSADYWMNDRWEHPLRTRTIRDFYEHFKAHYGVMPGWPDDWEDPRYQEKFVYPGLEDQDQWALLQEMN